MNNSLIFRFDYEKMRTNNLLFDTLLFEYFNIDLSYFKIVQKVSLHFVMQL